MAIDDSEDQESGWDWCSLVPAVVKRRFAVSKGQTDRLRRRVLAMLFTIGLVPALIATAANIARENFEEPYLYLGLSQSVLSLVGLAYVTLAGRISTAFVLSEIAGTAAVVLAIDFIGASSLQFRTWPVLVILVDILLVCQVQPRATVTAAGVGVLWLFCIEVEMTARFGWFDMPGTPGYDARVAFCSCEDPPCRKEVIDAFLQFSITALVFIGDFLFTRSFATQLLEKQESLRQGIAAAGDISTLLAAFDLNGADRALSEHERKVPGDLHRVLDQLLANLRLYEPYLPQSCLQSALRVADSNSTDAETSVSHPPRETDAQVLTFSASLSSLCEPASPHARLVEVQRKTVTVAALNLAGSLTRLKSRGCFEDTQRVLVSAALRAVVETKGTIELFMGDRITASWNASRTCVNQQACAVEAACMVEGDLKSSSLQVTSGVATGEALCGNLGVDSFMRHHVVGSVFPFALELEKVAKDWGMQIVIDSRVRRDVASSHCTRVVVERVAYLKRPAAEFAVLWEVLGRNTKNGEEWMYVVESVQMREAEVASDLALAYLSGDQNAAARLADRLHIDEPPQHSSMSTTRGSSHHLYLSHLLSCIAHSIDPPLITLPLQTPSHFPKDP
ncbi:Adenylate cyclase 1 [Diplonema papillatum]|nr:Adenylate cyclase 1 [Diplonema papillatum]